MAPSRRRVGLSVLFCLVALLALGSQAQDAKLFETLYNSILDLVAPNGDGASPTQVLLMEMPGIAINRAEWDPSVWAANNYQGRQPEAVAATFVDRLPLYVGSTFVDSGSTISGFWRNFVYQYVVPVVVNPEQELKISILRPLLFNGTLTNAYQTRASFYEATQLEVDNLRDACLAKSSPAICSKRMVISNEKLRRAWFSLEVARRDIAAAEATMLALQVQDLKNVFADALERFASNERIDVGAAGFGQSYWVTYLTPSVFWRWWPQNVGAFDYSVNGGNVLTFTANFTSPTVSVPPTRGEFTFNPATRVVTYTPNPSFTGIDRIAFSYVNAKNVTSVSVVVIKVVGDDVLLADTAFMKVSISSSSQSSSSTRSTAYSSTFQSSATSNSERRDSSWGWWWYSGASSSQSSSQSSQSSATSSYASSSSFSQQNLESSISFELARVNIARPWLDTAILRMSPVAVRGVRKNGWSDGTISPSATYAFKILPVAFLVSRNIKISNKSWNSAQAGAVASISSASSSYSSGQSSRASVGPWWAGSSSASSSGSSSSSARDYQETSAFVATAGSAEGTLSIQGPQIIAWLCTPVPAFPTASEEEVVAFEDAQLAKYTKKQDALRKAAPLPTSAVV